MKQYGIAFRDPGLLKLALTHRSYLSVTGQGPRESNERLEFLGDSVLGLVTSEYLYRRHPDEHEGQLTKTKSLLVSKAILSRRALRMGLGRFVLLSHSEVESGGRQRLSILADAFESVLGAIYLDQGFETARRFIHQWLLAESDAIVSDKRHTNYKSHLQEYVQSTYHTHPVYRIRSEYGPDHSKHFMVEVMVGRRTLGEGRGHNKKEAEQAAARDAIERVEKPARDARAPKSREPEAAAGGEEGESREGRRRRGRRSRGRDHDHDRDREHDHDLETEVGRPAAASAGSPTPWAEPDSPAESEEAEATDDEDVVEVYDDDLDDDDRAEDDDHDEEDAPETRRRRTGGDAASGPSHDEALLDPYGIEEEPELRAEANGSAEPADAADEPDAADEREARIEEIERAMASFGRPREHYGSAQRYGRKGRRGR